MSAPPAVPVFRAGDVLHLTRSASPQFAHPITLRVIRELEWSTFDGWRWVDGYQLGPDGGATARRSLYVRADGVRKLDAPPRRPAAPRRLAAAGVSA
ncbi:hypothetical protein [Micromonospora aurantiaca (nom. illeg.)]|uniref:hypothetical protein n=1 Tax=Micromonospora aurantiaca (nom. illeg.) TaxID=47850 RepID=UPI0001BF28D2|nr:hypothetical protein [Micromonospora aurantiaca]ADL48490.1 hypothetical protein Micau_4982 [Micromonospora aurantiaca ATCC 27029]